jgi:hypothetical protein
MSNINNNQNLNPTQIQSKNNTGSIILNLEKISTEYNNVLTQYNQARSNYINYLKTKAESVDSCGNSVSQTANQDYIILKNTFYGQNTLVNPIQTTNIANCKNQCSAVSSCTGANFVNGSTCLLMKDTNGELSPKQESNAIVPPEVYYLTTLKQLNQQLIDLNAQLTKQINEGQPIYEKQVQEREKQSEVLDKNYKNLVSERDKIELQLKEYDDITEAQTNSTLIVNKNYTLYKYLIFAFIIIIIILVSLPSNVSNQITQQIGGKMIDNYYTQFICGFIILAMILFYYYY